MHRFIHCTLLRRKAYYEKRFGAARKAATGMFADFSVDQSPWHRHYRYEAIRTLVPQELETVARAVYFPAFRALWSFRLALSVMSFGRLRNLPMPLNWLDKRWSRRETLLGDQLVILFEKPA